MNTETRDLAEGERRKAEALALLADRREAVIRRAQRALVRVLLETGTANADDVRDLVELPEGINPKCFGSVPGALARAGVIRAAGFVKTCRPTAHARPVTVWTLVDPAAAVLWLATHPELPDPATDQAELPAVFVQGSLFDLQKSDTPAGADAGAATE